MVEIGHSVEDELGHDVDWKEPPRPARRRLRTFFRRPLNVRRYLDPIEFDEVGAALPSDQELSHFGEVILLEDCAILLHRDGTTTYYNHYITVLHGSNPLASWDKWNAVYDVRSWKPTIRRAIVRTPDGSVRKASVRAIRNPYQTIRSLEVTYAPLRPGVIVEQERQDDLFKPNEIAPGLWGEFLLRTWAPCRRRRLSLAITEPFRLRMRLHNGCDAPTETSAGRYRVFTWQVSHANGAEWDDWTPPLRDWVPWVDYSTLPSPAPIARHFVRELGVGAKPPQQVAELARGILDRPVGEEIDRVASAFEYTARHVRYGRPQDEVSLRTTRPLGRIVEELRGDCKDKSALLVSILEELGIKAQIALLSLRSNGRQALVPSPRFDHAVVVAKLRDRDVWMDPAAGPYTFGDLPYNIQGALALQLALESSSNIVIPAPEPRHHRLEHVCKGRIESEDALCLEGRLTAFGERAAEWRQALLDRSPEYQVRHLEQVIAEDWIGAEVQEVEVASLEDLRKPFSFQYRLSLPGFGRRIESLILFGVPWWNRVYFRGPHAAKARTQPFLLRASLAVDRLELDIPLGLTGYGLPFERAATCRWGNYKCVMRVDGRRLVGERSLMLQDSVVPSEQFAEWRRFWEFCSRTDAAGVAFLNGSRP